MIRHQGQGNNYLESEILSNCISLTSNQLAIK